MTAHQSDADLSDSSELSEQSDLNKQNKFNDCDTKNNFCAKDIEYFNLNLNVDFIKICKNKQIYYNVFFLIN